MKNYKTVDDYIANADEWAKPTLEKLRHAIKNAAPSAKESISYHMPYYSQDGRLAYFGAYKNHCSFHWISEKDRKTFKTELANQEVVGSTLRIPKGEDVPVNLIKDVVKLRVDENQSRKGKMSKEKTTENKT